MAINLRSNHSFTKKRIREPICGTRRPFHPRRSAQDPQDPQGSLLAEAFLHRAIPPRQAEQGHGEAQVEVPGELFLGRQRNRLEECVAAIPQAHVFIADHPGLKKEEVKVEVDGDGYLIISGERKAAEDREAQGGDGKKSDGGSEEKWNRVESFRGKFSRQFRLLQNAKREEIKACMEDGVLTVIVSVRVWSSFLNLLFEIHE